MSIFKSLNEESKNAGGEFIGSIVFLSVNMENDVLLQDLIDGIHNHPVVPDKWAPEPLNHLSLYLSTMTSLNRGSLSKFQYSYDKYGFSAKEHGGFSVHRIYLRSDDEYPTAHKVFALKRIIDVVRDKDGAIVDKKIRDVEVDDGILVTLHRTEGSKETDKVGRSKFTIEYDGTLTPQYEMFLDTLQREFDERRNERYTSEQIRSLLITLLKEGMDATPIKRGDYFLEGRHLDRLEALQEVLINLDRGIKLNPLHIVRFRENKVLNQTFESVQNVVQESVLKEMQMFVEELNHLEEKDSKTRDSTWKDRNNKFLDLQLKLKRFKNKQLIEMDILEELVDEAKAVLRKYDH